MIKVANVIEDARFGGPHKRIINVADAGVELFETVFFLPRKDSVRSRKKSSEKNIECITYSSHPLGISLKRILNYLLYFFYDIFSLVKAIRKSRCNVVHVSSGVASFRSVIAGYMTGLPVVWHMNDTNMSPIVVRCARLFKWIPATYIYASHATRDTYSTQGFRTNNDFVIPAPVDNRVGWSDKFNKEPRLKVGLLGNVNPNKGQLRLVEIAELANKRGLNIDFVFAGFIRDSQQSYHDSVMRRVTALNLANVKYLGGLEDVNDFFNSVDVSLCISRFESSPQSVWESLAAGRIVCSTNVGDVGRYIESGENGFLISNDDLNGVVDLLLSIYKLTDNELKTMSLKAKESVQTLSVEIISREHLKAYSAAIGKSHSCEEVE